MIPEITINNNVSPPTVTFDITRNQGYVLNIYFRATNPSNNNNA
jgi:hypothetical protein